MTKHLIPKSKFDIEAAKRAAEAGYPAVKPVLGELTEWLQDYNWPVARVLAPFLASIGSPLVPFIDHVFSTTDETWQYWMIECLIAKNDDLFKHYQPKLIQLAKNPTANDKLHELDQVAQEALVERGLGDAKS